MSVRILPQPPRTPQSIYETVCPECGGHTIVQWCHVGGKGRQPHLVCPNHEGGCQTYLVCRLDPDQYNAYLDWLIKMDKAMVGIRPAEDEPPPTATEEQRLRVRCLELEGKLLNVKTQLEFLCLKGSTGHGVTGHDLMDIATAIAEAMEEAGP